MSNTRFDVEESAHCRRKERTATRLQMQKEKGWEIARPGSEEGRACCLARIEPLTMAHAVRMTRCMS